MFLPEVELGQDSVVVNPHRLREQGSLIAHTALRVPGWLTNSSSSSTSNSNSTNSSSNSNSQLAAVRPAYSAIWRISDRTSQLWACSTSTNRQLICARPTSHFKAGPGNAFSEASVRNTRTVTEKHYRNNVNVSSCRRSFVRRSEDSCGSCGNSVSD